MIPPQPILIPPAPVLIPPDPVTIPSDPIAIPPDPVAIPLRPLAIPLHPVAIPLYPVLIPPDPVVIPPVLCQSHHILFLQVQEDVVGKDPSTVLLKEGAYVMVDINPQVILFCVVQLASHISPCNVDWELQVCQQTQREQ